VNACSACCQDLLARLHGVKASIQNEFQDGFRRQVHVLQLVLNEAEAQACETGFPLLVFPTLAREKAEAALTWNQRQEAMLQTAPVLLREA